MKIELNKIPIRDLVEGYTDNAEEGVVGYGGKLNIRPPFQREFFYKGKEREAVINSVLKNYPLNTMYWVHNLDAVDEKCFEVLDGQQRTISICDFVANKYSISLPLYGKDNEPHYFASLQEPEQKQIMDYNLTVYYCEGDPTEQLEWFQTINIPGAELTNQEALNAIYSGPWTTDAKRYFSKNGCPAYDLASKYMSGSPIRQKYLETVIRWISNDEIGDYMANNKLKTSAKELWHYFELVIEWVTATFPETRKEMKGVQWGFLYHAHKDKELDPDALEAEIGKLMIDDEVTDNKGIYAFVLDRDKRHLNLRGFTEAQKRELWNKQKGKCKGCDEKFTVDDMHAHHKKSWAKGGKTIIENGELRCEPCHTDYHSKTN